MRRLGVLLLLPALGLAQSPDAASVKADANAGNGAAQVGFMYENPQLQPGKYRFLIYENGSGFFHSEPSATPPADTISYNPLPRAVDRAVQLSKPTSDQIFATARNERFFSVQCEDRKNKVAFQGTKQLTYQGPDGSGTCTYNWSKIVEIQKITSMLEAIAFTLEEGRRLELEHKHDRLALDAELGTLADAVKDARALELGTIQPVLQAIVDDEAVLVRARERARKLLDGAGVSRASLP